MSSSLVTALICHLWITRAAWGPEVSLVRGQGGAKLVTMRPSSLTGSSSLEKNLFWGSFAIRSSTRVAWLKSVVLGCSFLLWPGPEGTGRETWGGRCVTCPWVAQLEIAPPSTFSQLCLEWGHLTEANRSIASPQAPGTF